MCTRTRQTCPHLTALLLLASAVSSVALGQSEELAVDELFPNRIHREYSMDDGLPSNWINDIIQSRDHYIWIATDNGLVRYDGYHFKLFDQSNTSQLPFNEIRTLFEDRQGIIWIGTSYGLARYIPGRPGKFEEVSEVPHHIVHTAYQDEKGLIWIGTQELTYVRRGNSSFEKALHAPENVRAFCEDHEGIFWVGANSGLYRRTGEDFERIIHERLPESTSAKSGVLQTRVNTILADKVGGLWIGTHRGVLHFKDGKFTSRGLELEQQQVYEFLQTRNGDVYAAARFGLYRSTLDRDFEKLPSQISVFSVLEDRDGTIWVGYGDNRKLHCYRNNHANAVWNEAQVRCVTGNRTGGLLIGSSLGLHHLHDGKIANLGTNEGLPDPRVHTIAPSQDGGYWLGTGRGIVKLSHGKLLSVNEVSAAEGMNVGLVLEDSRGGIWGAFATYGGFRIQNGKLTTLKQLSDGRIYWFWEDPSGVLWIGHESGLYRYRDGILQRVDETTFRSLKFPRFHCYFVAEDGTLWMGTSNGIARYRNESFEVFPPACGLRADNIERLAVDGTGTIWFAGRDGLFHTSVAELDDYSAGRLSKVTTFRVDGFERFPPVRAFSQGSLVQGDVLWLVGEQGLIQLPTAPFQQEPTQPMIHVDFVQVDGKSSSFEEPFQFRSGRKRFRVGMSVPCFENPELIQIRYRLDPYDADWHQAGTDRIAYYADLPPNDYRFRVAMKQGNQEWIETDPGVRFTVQPRWWETMWFRVILSAGFLAMVALATLQYTSRVRRRNSELEREITDRKRAEKASREHLDQLARVSRAATMGELTTSIAHEIKQPLFAIVSNAQSVKLILDQDNPDLVDVREALEDIVGDGNRASGIIDHIRSLVKKEHRLEEELNVNDVVRAVTKLITPEIRNREIDLKLDLASELPAIRGNPIELQQVVMNLMINAIDSMEGIDSQRTLVVKTSDCNGLVEVAIRDDGAGVEEAMLDQLFKPFFTTKSEGIGMGLAINLTIIESHGGRIWATRNSSRGMTFHFRIPSCQGESKGMQG